MIWYIIHMEVIWHIIHVEVIWCIIHLEEIWQLADYYYSQPRINGNDKHGSNSL